MQKTRTITLSYILLELSLPIYFHKRWVFFVMSCCTSGVGFQVLPFIAVWGAFLACSYFLVNLVTSLYCQNLLFIQIIVFLMCSTRLKKDTKWCYKPLCFNCIYITRCVFVSNHFSFKFILGLNLLKIDDRKQSLTLYHLVRNGCKFRNRFQVKEPCVEVQYFEFKSRLFF